MYMLERNQECLAYFELAHAILECELGPSHERTMTVSALLLESVGPAQHHESEENRSRYQAPVQTTMDDSPPSPGT